MLSLKINNKFIKDMQALIPKSNIANKVRNTKLPRTKSLLPLFEVISNSTHSIDDAIDTKLLKSEDAEISIRIIRQGNEELYRKMGESIDNYPVCGFEITDNGIGFNNDNLSYFVEADTDHKLKIGGKGIGRFVCLKAFKKMHINSIYLGEDNQLMHRKFTFVPTKIGFENECEERCVSGIKKTTVSLIDYYEEYQKHTPKSIIEIAREITTHFQLLFLDNKAPKIIIQNQNEDYVSLNDLFIREYEKTIQTKSFTVGKYNFDVILTKSYKAQSHKLLFCAHNRAVKEEGLYQKIIDLGKYSIKGNGEAYYYQAFITGELLDERVDGERVNFDIESGDDEDEESLHDSITLAKIRNKAVKSIEELLADYLDSVRKEKMAKYKPIIEEQMPQYRNIFRYQEEKVKRLSPNLSNEKLDIELYKIEANWKLEVKEKGLEILDAKKDVTTLEEYKEKYQQFLTEFNDVGQAELARYIVHRRAVIELLDKMIGKTEEDRFTNEDIIHSIFFPIRSSSDDVPFNKQNLWLLDERLAYHSFLASDKTFDSMKHIESTSKDRPDLLIFNDALVFAEEDIFPHNSFTIIEFKKPQRDNYIDEYSKKNPLDQVEDYISEILKGKVTNRKGRKIDVDKNIPFYVYIICDITESFRQILEKREFKKTPDGIGYFKAKSEYYSAFIEVIPFEKVLSDAKKRNRILFEKLGLLNR